MKKTITKLMAALALLLFVAPPLVGWGQTSNEVTYTFSQHYNANTTLTDVAIAFDDNITATFHKGSGSTAPQYYTNGTAVRWYGGNTLDITATNATISAIEFTYTQKNKDVTANVGEYNHDEGTWTGSESSVTFTVASGSGHNRVSEIKVTYTTSGGTPAPSITANNVEIAYDATEGAIEYTINNGIDGGVLSAATEAEWLTIGTVGETVPFTCSVNDNGERVATVTLTYTYDTDQTVTKNVTVTQATNPNGPGSEANPYTVAQARAAIDAGTGTQGVYATGIVSEIVTAYSSQYGNITFDIVDAAGDQEFLRVYRCDGEEAANVTVGDIAVVYGNLILYNNSIYEFAQGCQVVSLEHPVITDPYITANNVEITYDTDADEIAYIINNPVDGGVLTVATTSDWLMVDDQEYTDSEGIIEFLCEVNQTAAPRTATVTLTYTYGDSQTVTKDVTVTQNGNPNIVDLISDITEVGTAYTVRGTVVATNSRGFIMGDGTGYVYYYKGSAPAQTVGDMVKVSGTTGTYGQIIQFTSQATIAEATASNYNGTPEATVLTEVPDYTEGYHISDYLQFEGLLEKSDNNYLITLGEAQIQISYPTSEQGVALTALDDKEVLVKGYFSGINSSGKFTVMLESVEEIVSAEPSITVTPYLVEVDADEHDGTLDLAYENLTITNLDDFGIQYYDAQGEETSEPDWIEVLVAEQDPQIGEGYVVSYYMLENEGEARSAYFKVYALGDEDFVYSNLVTINQAEYVVDYATLPFGYEGNGQGTLPAGLTVYGTGTYNSSPMIQFNNADSNGIEDYVILKINEEPGVLTFDIKGNGFSGGTFRMQTSVDGMTYTDKVSYTEMPTSAETQTISDLASDVRYIKWSYTKVNGNVAFGNITLAQPDYTPSITVAPATVNVDAAEHDGTLTVTYENIPELISFDIQFCDANGNELEGDDPDWIGAEIQEENDVYSVYYIINANEGEARSAYFKVYTFVGDEEEVYSNLVTINQAAYVPPVVGQQFALFGGNLVEGDYIIYYNGRAMNNVVSSGRLQYAGIEPENNVITTDNAAIVWHIAQNDEGYWTIYSADANAYAASTGVKNKAQLLEDGTDDMAMWTVTEISGTYEFVNKANAAGGINANLRNNGTYGFACYAIGTGGALSLYKYTETVEIETYTLNITGYSESEGGYYLIASPILAVVPTVDNGFLADETNEQEKFDLYYFDQSQNDEEWRNYDANHFNLVSGKGYLYASKESTTLTFSGAPYSGDGIITLVKENNTDWAGWNLVGNPFGQTAYIDHDFYTVNQEGSEIMPDACTGAVEAMQGVFVLATEDGETLTFTTGEAPEAAANVTLNLSQNRGTVIDRAIVRFGEGRQLPKFQLNTESTKLYIPQSNKDYAVVRSAAQGEMPVNFKASKNGSYTLAIDAENVEMSYLHLIDNMTGADVDLLATPSYTFDAKTTDYASRFKLVFSANANENDDENETFAFFNGSVWCISNTGEATLQVVDMLGRIVSSESVNGNATLSTDNLMSGVYMFRLVNGENVKVQKVVVK